MGRHSYPCPLCSNRQSLEAPNGQDITPAPCAACTEAIEQYRASKGRLKAEEVTRATAASLAQIRAWCEAHPG